MKKVERLAADVKPDIFSQVLKIKQEHVACQHPLQQQVSQRFADQTIHSDLSLSDYIALYLWNHLEKVNQPIQQLTKSEKFMVVVEFKLMWRWNM